MLKRTQVAALIRLARLFQWHKNVFVLFGFFFLGDYTNLELFLRAIVNTLAFCFASSSAYIFNDYCDLEADRRHPAKMRRPLAAGAVSLMAALSLGAVLALASLLLAAFNGAPSQGFILGYLVLNLLYSLGLKQLPILDVFLIAVGFILRIFAGTACIGIALSEWLFLTGFMLSMLIGFSKRYAEISNHTNEQSGRTSLAGYSVELLRIYVVIFSTATILAYALYTVSEKSVKLHGSSQLIYSAPVVVVGVLRYLQLTFVNRSGEDPAELVVRDGPLLLLLAIWMLVYVLIV